MDVYIVSFVRRFVDAGAVFQFDRVDRWRWLWLLFEFGAEVFCDGIVAAGGFGTVTAVSLVCCQGFPNGIGERGRDDEHLLVEDIADGVAAVVILQVKRFKRTGEIRP